MEILVTIRVGFIGDHIVDNLIHGKQVDYVWWYNEHEK